MTERQDHASAGSRWLLVVPAVLLIAVLFLPSGSVYRYEGGTDAERAALCGARGCDGGVVARWPVGRLAPAGGVALLGLIFLGLAASDRGARIDRSTVALGIAVYGIAILLATSEGHEAWALAQTYALRGRLNQEIAPFIHRAAALGLIAYAAVLAFGTSALASLRGRG